MKSDYETEATKRGAFRRVIKLLISVGVFALSSMWILLRRIVGMHSAYTCIILYYHEVLAQHRPLFAHQMDLLLRWATVIPVDKPWTAQRGGRYVAVTFDDGFDNVAEHAVPELVKRQIPSTIFVMSDLLGQTPSWSGFSGRFMSLEELQALPSDLVSLGSHTKTHPFLPRLTKEEATSEIRDSRIKLQKMLGQDIKSFSFPYGGFNNQLVEICRNAGYQRTFTTLPQSARLGPNDFVSGRVSVEPTDWQIEFFLKLRGAYNWLSLAFAFKRKIRSLMTRQQLREWHAGGTDSALVQRDE